MDKLQLTGQNLGRVFNFRSGHLHAAAFLVSSVKLPNLKLKTRPKQLLGPLPLVVVPPGDVYHKVLHCTSEGKSINWKSQAQTELFKREIIKCRLYSSMTMRWNKLDSLSRASIFSYLHSTQFLKHIGAVLCTLKCKTKLKKLVCDKHSSLF